MTYFENERKGAEATKGRDVTENELSSMIANFSRTRRQLWKTACQRRYPSSGEWSMKFVEQLFAATFATLLSLSDISGVGAW